MPDLTHKIVRSASWFAAGAVCGGVAMYWCDPAQGRRRRHTLRDRVRHWRRIVERRTFFCARNLQHHLQGGWAEARTRIVAGPVDDTVLVERIRAALGHVVHHPRGIVVTSDDGVVTLSGPVDGAADLYAVTAAVRRVPGVTDLANHLTQD